MFKRDTKPATAVVETKPPMVSGGAAMMLKSLGVDPSQMEDLANAFLRDVSAMAKRIDELEQGNRDLSSALATTQATLARQTVLLEAIASKVGCDE